MRPLWSDEIITLNTLSVNILDNPLFTGVTTNLPFYFWVTSFLNWIFNPTDPRMLRVWGILLNLAGGWLFYRFLLKHTKENTALIFLLLFTFSPLQIHYSAELRPYVLSQFLIILLFILINKDLNNKRNVVLINLVTALGMLTHYSFYIFCLGAGVCVLLKSKGLKTLVKTFLLPTVLAGLITCIYFNNPLFKDSLQGLNLQRSYVSIDSVERVKEVLTNYYYFGLYYYRLDFLAQFILKKLFLVLVLLGTWVTIKDKDSRKKWIGISLLVTLSASLLIALLGEILGYYPFGGRHIMPFSFLLYAIVALALHRLTKIPRVGKIITTLLLLTVLVSFIAFQSCSQIFLNRYTGTGDPQGDIYNYCMQGMLDRIK